MFTHVYAMKPVVGMTMTFKDSAETSLAGVPATVVDIWPRFRSGDYLVTLEYAQPVKVGKELVRRIDAFLCELDEVVRHELAREVNATPASSFRRAV